MTQEKVEGNALRVELLPPHNRAQRLGAWAAGGGEHGEPWKDKTSLQEDPLTRGRRHVKKS